MDLPASNKPSKAISSFIVKGRISGQKVIGRSGSCSKNCAPLFNRCRAYVIASNFFVVDTITFERINRLTSNFAHVETKQK